MLPQNIPVTDLNPEKEQDFIPALRIVMIELVEVAHDQEIRFGVPLGPGVGVGGAPH